MFYLKEENKNVKGFAIKENDLWWNTDYEVFNDKKELIVKSENQLQKINYDNPFLFISDIEGNSFLLGDKNKRLKNIFIKKKYNQESLIVSNEGKTMLLKIDNEGEHLYNLLEQRLFTFFLFNNVLFYKNKTQIHAYTLPEATLKWQFNLETLGTWLYDKQEKKSYTVDKFIGVWQKQLLVSCFSGLIISIDVNNGKLLNQWSAYPSSFTMNGYTVSNINPSYCSMLDEQENKLIGFNHFTLWKIDLQTAKLSAFDLQEQFKVQDLYSIHQIKGFVVNTTHYIISAKTSFKEQLNRRLDCLIAINKETLTIDWKHQFKDNEALKTDIPQYANDKLYQLDWNNTLHIFEKENIDNTIS